MSFYRSGTLLLSALIAALGIALLVRAALAGNPYAALIGVLFLAAGGGRVYLLRRR